jgi:hypothetical protein
MLLPQLSDEVAMAGYNLPASKGITEPQQVGPQDWWCAGLMWALQCTSW